MTDLKAYGYKETTQPPQGTIPGRITEHHRDKYTVITQHGEVTASLKGSFYHNAEERADFPCVGDFVYLQHNQTGDSRIASLLPRYTKFSRADFSGHAAGYAKTIREQVVAANFDYVFITSSLNHDYSTSRITRYITQVRQSGGQPVIILTKADLADNYDIALIELYQAEPDVPVCVVSAHTGFGLDTLGEYLQPGKTVVFLGMSGVASRHCLTRL